MADELKLVLLQINNLCGTDYNLASFNSLGGIDVLKVLVHVLKELRVWRSTDFEENINEGTLELLSILQAIKYTPEDDMDPKLFREGLTRGDKSVVCPIFKWVLANQRKVKELAYLTRFVEKIMVPVQYSRDRKVRDVYKMYESTVTCFWKVYKENTQLKKNVNTVDELQNDIKKMKRDLVNITRCRHNQGMIFHDNLRKQNLILRSEKYRKFKKESKMVFEQIDKNQREIQVLQVKVCSIEQKRTGLTNKSNINVLQQIRITTKNNKTKECNIRDRCKRTTQLQEILEKVTRRVRVSENEVRKTISLVSNDVISLQNMKTNMFEEDKEIYLLRKQSDEIRSKKNSTNIFINDLKETLNQLEKDIQEKEDVTITEKMREFVRKLKELSEEYKKRRRVLKSLEFEMEKVVHTFDVLQSINMTLLDDNELDQCVVKKNRRVLCKNVPEAKSVVNTMTIHVKDLKFKACKSRDNFLKIRKEVVQMLMEYERMKERVDVSLKYQHLELEKFSHNVTVLNDNVTSKEAHWKLQSKNLQKLEQIFNELLDDLFYGNEGNQKNKFLETLNNKLQAIENLVKAKQVDVEQKERTQVMMRKMIHFFKCVEVFLTTKLSC